MPQWFVSEPPSNQPKNKIQLARWWIDFFNRYHYAYPQRHNGIRSFSLTTVGTQQWKRKITNIGKNERLLSECVCSQLLVWWRSKKHTLWIIVTQEGKEFFKFATRRIKRLAEPNVFVNFQIEGLPEQKWMRMETGKSMATSSNETWEGLNDETNDEDARDTDDTPDEWLIQLSYLNSSHTFLCIYSVVLVK